MKCPKCGKEDSQQVINSRHNNSGYIIRRRECECGNRFSTIEAYELNEKTMMAFEREMRRNCSPRAFEKITYSTYQKKFNRSQYLKERDAV